jgi:uncharacterized protein (TIGR04255 family)
MGQFRDDEIYPNQPLSDVACEIRFKGEMQVECQRYLFWDKIRSEYPDILVPHVQDGQAVALQHYKFRNPGGGRTVSVALNSLAFSEAKYSGHVSFISEFGRLVDIFRGLYPKLGAITRVGWRYINVIPFSREDGLVPISRLLKLNISLPSDLFGRTSALNLEWVGKLSDGEVHIRLEPINQKGLPGQEALLLDIDFGCMAPNIDWSSSKSVIESARKKCRGLFEDLITDDYRTYLRGESL